MLGRYEVNDEASFQSALLHVKEGLKEIQFSELKSAQFLTAVSELARNILKYAERGYLEIYKIHHMSRVGVKLIAIDHGPGISNIKVAMRDKFSSSGTLGQGLPGAKRLVDEFNISSSSQGTEITIVTWND